MRRFKGSILTRDANLALATAHQHKAREHWHVAMFMRDETAEAEVVAHEVANGDPKAYLILMQEIHTGVQARFDAAAAHYRAARIYMRLERT